MRPELLPAIDEYHFMDRGLGEDPQLQLRDYHVRVQDPLRVRGAAWLGSILARGHTKPRSATCG